MSAGFDKRVVAASFSRAASCYDGVASLQRLVAEQVLSWCPLEAGCSALDIGCGTGYLLRRWADECPTAQLVGLDLAGGMLAMARRQTVHPVVWIQGDVSRLPFSPRSFDRIVSNFAMQWCDDMLAAMGRISDALRSGGRFVMALPAEDSLCELQDSWRQADPSGTHVSDFYSEASLVHHAREAGLVLERSARLIRRAYHPSVQSLMQEIKTLGAHNASHGRPRHLMPKGRYRDFVAAYEAKRCVNGKLPATWCVLLMEFSVP